MEDSLDTADAMRSRGWGCGVRRTSYQLQSFGARDAVLLVIMVVLLAASIVSFVLLTSNFAFYPTVSSLGNPLLYIPYALFLLVPFVLEFMEWLRWQ